MPLSAAVAFMRVSPTLNMLVAPMTIDRTGTGGGNSEGSTGNRKAMCLTTARASRAPAKTTRIIDVWLDEGGELAGSAKIACASRRVVFVETECALGTSSLGTSSGEL
jgi:hypothetical protein